MILIILFTMIVGPTFACADPEPLFDVASVPAETLMPVPTIVVRLSVNRSAAFVVFWAVVIPPAPPLLSMGDW